MLVRALLGRGGGRAGRGHRALDGLAVLVGDGRPVAGDDDHVALLEISDPLRQRSERERVGSEERLALAEPDDQRRSAPCADQQAGVIAKSDRQRECAAQAGQDRCYCSVRGNPFRQLDGNQMRDDFAIGLAFEHPPRPGQLGAQRFVVLDDAIVHQRDGLGRVRMRVRLARRAVGRPARMGDARASRQGVGSKFGGQVRQFAGRAAAQQFAARRAGIDGCHAGAVIAAIFHPLEPAEQAIGDGAGADDPDDSAHVLLVLRCFSDAPARPVASVWAGVQRATRSGRPE